MKYIIIVLLFLCLMSCHSGRQSSCEDVPVEKDSVQLRVIPVSISDTAYRNVDQTFEQISYVVLSDNVVIGEIVRTLVSDERIFILDNQNKLFCFDMQGKVEYVIDEHGSGPNEYGNVLDFALNPPLKMLWMYDSTRRKLHCYDMYTGNLSLPLIWHRNAWRFGTALFSFSWEIIIIILIIRKCTTRCFVLCPELKSINLFSPMIERQSLGFPMGRNILFIIITISCILSRIMKQSFIS